MQRLREVVGDDKNDNNKFPSNGNISLDGQQISQEDLNEKRANQPNSQRIVEVNNGEYKTLNRMYS